MVKEVQEAYKMTELGEIPVEWEVKTLNQISFKILDGVHSTPKYTDKGIRFLSVENVTNSNFKDTKYISLEDHQEFSRRCNVEKNDILMTRIGTIGIPKLVDWDFEASIYVSLALIKLKNKNQAKYIAQYMKSNVFLKETLKRSLLSATPQKINLGDIGKIPVIIPPLKEQQKIAGILSSADEQIENIDQLINKTRELKKGLMQQLLTKGIGHKEIKQSKLGEIPTDWEIIALEEASKVIRGASPRPKGDPRYYGGNIPRLMIADITRDGKFVTPQIDFLTEEGAKKSRPMPKGTFVIACSGTYVGYPSILNVDACIHDGIIAIVDFEKSFDVGYLYYVFTRLYNELNSSATHGGVFNNLTTQIIKELKIVKPPLEEQQKIAEVLSTVDNQIESYEQEKEKYTELKKGLMQQLLTGKIRVTV